MRAIVLFFLLAGMLSLQLSLPLSAYAAGAKKINIVNTIKPIQALVLAIAGDRVNSDQLIPDYASPHFYSFKPSDLRKIKKANVIFRIDESMEMMLNPAFKNASPQAKLISLADFSEVKLLHVIEEHDSHDHSSDHNSEEHKEHGDHIQNMDMHIWTSPDNAIAMSKQIAQVLGESDPENKGYYDDNVKQLIHQIKATSLEIESQLKTVKNKPYIVFHDSWQYFSQYYGLQKSTQVSLHEGIAPGAKTLPKIRKQIQSKNIHCLFSKPGMNPKWINALTEGLEHVKSVEIDVIASSLKMSDQMYIQWLHNMGKQITSCLSE